MVGSEVGVRGTTGQKYGVADIVNDLPFAAVLGTDSAEVTDIVREGGHSKQYLFAEGDWLLLGEVLADGERPSVTPY